MKNKTIKRQNSSHLNKTAKCVYSKNDFNSNDGMLTTVWGPAMWHVLHTMSFNYPIQPTNKDKLNYMRFVSNLQNTLPCGKCRENLKKNFKKLPLTIERMQSRDTFSKYIYLLHEAVNRMLKKKSGLTYSDVRERYEHFRARCVLPLSDMDKELQMQLGKHAAKEVGCVEPLFGEKSKCIIHIVPQTTKCDTFQIDEKCIKRKKD